MSTPLNILSLVLASAMEAKGLEAAKDPLISNVTTVVASITTVVTTIIGVIVGLLTAWKAQAEIYKGRLDQYKIGLDLHLSSIERSSQSEIRSLEIILRQKDADIVALKDRIQRLEGFCSLNPPSSLDKKREPILDNIRLFLQYVEGRIGEGNQELVQEIKKVTAFLETLGIVDKQTFRFEAKDWLDNHLESLIEESYQYLQQKLMEGKNEIPPGDEIKRSISTYLKRLSTMLTLVGNEHNERFREKTKERCKPGYTEALIFIRDQRVNGRINHYAIEELKNCINAMIETIDS
jgi:hypothetical protein